MTEQSERLTEAQKRGLRFLAKEPWKSQWWGGKPYCGWPKELNGKSLEKLREYRFVVGSHSGFTNTFTITDAGRRALKSSGGE